MIFGLCSLMAGCAAPYQTPPRDEWNAYLAGASFGPMSAPAMIAKRPIFQDAGGRVLDAAAAPAYMAQLESELEESLRKPGIQIQMVGNDIVVVLVRDAFMNRDSAEFSHAGETVLSALSRVLNKYSQTFIEISGYCDAMADQRAAGALTLDMAQRIAVYMARNDVATSRMFIMGRGSARPIAAQDDVGRLMNRRVEIRIAAVIKDPQKQTAAIKARKENNADALATYNSQLNMQNNYGMPPAASAPAYGAPPSSPN